jgi:hypothetical protein
VCPHAAIAHYHCTGGVIAVWATHSLPVIGQSRGDVDEDKLLLGTWKLNFAKSKYKAGIPPQNQIRPMNQVDKASKPL